MSRGRGLFATIFKNFVDSLRPRQINGRLVGEDHLGNSYFEIKPPAHSTKTRPSRYYVPRDKDVTKFDQQLPAEWEAWLRLRRAEPPTVEEVAANLKLMASKKLNAAEIDDKFRRIASEEEPDKVVTGIRDFPELPGYEKYPGKVPNKE